MRGPGVMRDMERRMMVDGRSGLDGEGDSGYCGVVGVELWASEGRMGAVAANPEGRGRVAGVKKCSGDCQGFSVSEDSPGSLVGRVGADCMGEVCEVKRWGV